MYRFLVACTTCINKQDSFLWNKKNCFRVLTIFKFFLETSSFVVLFIVAHLIWEENVHIFSLCINERVSFSKYVHAKPLLSHAYFQNVFLDYITCNYNYWSIWENQNVLGIQVLFFMGIRITYIQETGSILWKQWFQFPYKRSNLRNFLEICRKRSHANIEEATPLQTKKKLRNILKKKRIREGLIAVELWFIWVLKIEILVYWN